jgi:Flp pilus assembly protein TadG
MALVLPVFFLFCWGFMVLSFVLMGYGNATYASKMAARYAVMHGNTSPSPFTTAQLKAIAYQYLWGAPSATSTFVVIQTNGMNIGSAVNVGITVVYPTGIPFSSLSSVTIGASTTEVILE